MKKRVLSFLTVAMAVILMLVLLPTASFAAESDFTIQNGVLTKYNGAGGDVVIPEGVTSIGYRAFYGNTALTSVTIPDSVTSIKQGAFQDCTGLVSVNISDSVTDIYPYSFCGCSSLNSVTLSSALTYIPHALFKGCSSLISLVIPNSVTVIQGEAFAKSGLISVVIPDSVTSIWDNVFENCTGLTSATIGNSVTSIGKRAFYECKALTSVNIPDSVTSIEEETFYKCSSLTTATIGNSVTSIGDSAFYKCTALTSVTFGSSVESIGTYAFCGCSLISVSFPPSLTSIADYAFENSSTLTSLTLTNSVSTIGRDAFRACLKLTSVNVEGGEQRIDENATGIGVLAFLDCHSLTSVTIPNSITSIANQAFADCYALESVTIPESVTSVGDKVFEGTAWQSEQSELVIESGILFSCRNAYWEPTEVVIPDTVKIIAGSAFFNCNALTAVTIPDSVTSIGKNAFRYCNMLTSVKIPDGVTRIEDETFFGCNSLTSVTLPASITSIGQIAFGSSVTDIYYGGTEEQWNAIEIDYINSFLTSATIHYNCADYAKKDPLENPAVAPTVPTTATATPTGNTLLVDGAEKLPAAYLINDNNYFKLRDVAALLNGTNAQFNIGWDGVTGAITITTGEAYTALGTELAGAPTDVSTAQMSQSTVYINGEKADLTAYLINDNNYFKLRDLGKALGFNVSWDGIKGAVLIESNKPYSDAD